LRIEEIDELLDKYEAVFSSFAIAAIDLIFRFILTLAFNLAPINTQLLLGRGYD